ncbi:MAG: hypothetical protein ACYDCO_16005 [Armatimonadota bacterium]
MVGILARLSRFVIADITDPRCVPHELAWNVPQFQSVPVLPIIQDGAPYSMGVDLQNYRPVMPLHRYRDEADLVAEFDRGIIEPAEAKARELIRERTE